MTVSSPVEFSRGLSDPLQPNRVKALKSLNSWMEKNGKSHDFKSIEIDQLWRALQYTLWMADKRPIQQQVAAEAVLLIRQMSPELASEWNRGFWFNIEKIYETIDKYRIPKFHLLIRIYMAELFSQMKSRQWDSEFIKVCLSAIPDHLHRAVGAYMQIINVFVAELVATVESDNLQKYIKPRRAFHALIQPILCIVSNVNKYPISLVSKCLDAVLTDDRVVNYSSETRELIKSTIQSAAMDKHTPQDLRETLFSAIDSIEAIPAPVLKKRRVSDKQ
jgi:hypothetical protein